MDYLWCFLCGGLLCAVGQVLIDLTKLTPARILTGYVVAGVILQAVGLYQPLVDWAGAGATVPLTGFGYSLAKGVAKAVGEQGLLGVLTGGLTATAGGIAAAVCPCHGNFLQTERKALTNTLWGYIMPPSKHTPGRYTIWIAATVRRRSTAPTRSRSA